LPVGLPSHGRAKMAQRLMARMAMLRPEFPARLIVVVYLPPAGKCDFFQPGVPGRVARQAVAPRVSDGGVRVAGGAIQRGLNAARLQFNLYGVPRFQTGGSMVAQDLLQLTACHGREEPTQGRKAGGRPGFNGSLSGIPCGVAAPRPGA